LEWQKGEGRGSTFPATLDRFDHNPETIRRFFWREIVDLRVYLKLFLRWSWFVALATVAGAVLSLFVLSSLGALPSYSATATVAIGAEIFDSDQDRSYMTTASSLAPTYVELAKLEPVTQAVIETLSLPETTDELSELLDVSLIEGTQLIEIKATYRDAQMAAAIANEAARQLALQAPLRLRNFIVTIEAAKAPKGPGITSLAPVAIGGMLGFLLATGGVFLVDFLRDTINDSEDVAQRLGLATLAVVKSPSSWPSRLWQRWRGRRVEPETQPVWWSLMEASKRRYAASAGQTPGNPHNGHTPRLVLSKVEGNKTPLVLVTSSGKDEGQSSAAINLARTWACSGQTTLLVDAYLAKSRLHEELGLTNEVGLTSLLAEPTCSLEAVLQPIETVPGLRALTAGPATARSLAATTPAVRQALEAMRATAQVVIVNGPPVLADADAVMLAAQADGVLLVLRGGNTRTEQAAEAIQLLTMAGGSVWGAILNLGQP
jgi:Mrp family chromosome partitioning ATPase/capsular polysaccharide biosynthesis protein